MSHRERLIHLLLVAVLSASLSVVVSNRVALSTFDRLVDRIESHSTLLVEATHIIANISSRFSKHLNTARENTENRSQQLQQMEREQRIDRQLIIKLLKERPQ